MQSYTLRVSGYDTNQIRNERDVQQLFQTFFVQDEQIAKKAQEQIRGQGVQRQNVELVDNSYEVNCFYCDQNHWSKDCPNRRPPQRKEQSYSQLKKSCDNNRKEKRRSRRRNDSSDDECKKERRDDRSRSSSRHRSPIRIYININFKQ